MVSAGGGAASLDLGSGAGALAAATVAGATPVPGDDGRRRNCWAHVQVDQAGLAEQGQVAQDGHDWPIGDDVAHGALAVDQQENLDRASIERYLVASGAAAGARRGTASRDGRCGASALASASMCWRECFECTSPFSATGAPSANEKAAWGRKQRAGVQGVEVVVLTARGGDQVAVVESQFGGLVGRGEVQDARLLQLAKKAHERGQADAVESPRQFNHGEEEACGPRRGQRTKSVEKMRALRCDLADRLRNGRIGSPLVTGA